MTSFRDLLDETLGVGQRFELALVLERDAAEPEGAGRLVADHPNDSSPVDVAVLEGLDRLDERPPPEPVTVEITGRIVDGYVTGRVVDTERPDGDGA